MNALGIFGHDARQIEVVANGLPLFNGAQLAVDVTMVSPIRCNGTAQPRAAREDGAQLREARARKERKYRELLSSRRCRLIVVAMEAGGRWSEEAMVFVRLLATAKARSAPVLLRGAARTAYFHRWTTLLTVSAQRALARTLLELQVDDAEAVDGGAPPLAEVLAADARW